LDSHDLTEGVEGSWGDAVNRLLQKSNIPDPLKILEPSAAKSTETNQMLSGRAAKRGADLRNEIIRETETGQILNASQYATQESDVVSAKRTKRTTNTTILSPSQSGDSATATATTPAQAENNATANTTLQSENTADVIIANQA